MNRYVADTHALFWYLIDSPRLGSRASEAFEAGARGEAAIYISAIVLAELYFMNEKLGRPLDFSVEYNRLHESSQFIFVPLMPEDILDFDRDVSVPEMHDRIIIGVVRRMDAVCLSRDEEIVQSGMVPTIW